MCKPTRNPHELIGRSYVDMDDGFGELYCELKVLAMKTEDGFVKKKKKKRKRSCDSWRRSMTRDCEANFENFAILAKFSSNEFR